jgi:hypothetical protein
MLICLAELAERDGQPIRFVLFVHKIESAHDYLFHAEYLFERIDFVSVSDFSQRASRRGFTRSIKKSCSLSTAPFPIFRRSAFGVVVQKSSW